LWLIVLAACLIGLLVLAVVAWEAVKAIASAAIDHEWDDDESLGDDWQ